MNSIDEKNMELRRKSEKNQLIMYSLRTPKKPGGFPAGRIASMYKKHSLMGRLPRTQAPKLCFTNSTNQRKNTSTESFAKAVNTSERKVLKTLAPTLTQILSPAMCTRETKLIPKNKSINFHSFAALDKMETIKTTIAAPLQSEKQIEFPLTAADVLRMFGAHLTQKEKTEILDYSQIYYLSKDVLSRKLRRNLTKNCDDQNADYICIIGEQLDYRYEILSLLGKGSFGQVIKCTDHKRNQTVAVKIIRNKKKFYSQALVEIKILKFIKDQDETQQANIVKLLDSFVFRDHICIVFELLDQNLYEIIKKNFYTGFSLGIIRRFAIQLLQALHFLRDYSIIHCDLKPENILLRERELTGIRLIDFGSSCFETEQVYTYIQSRFYRAPEIMLALPYTSAIDMWSLGCILAELFLGFPLFPGEDEPEQIGLFISIIGLPPLSLLSRGSRSTIFFDSTGKPLLPIRSRKKLSSILNCEDLDFIDFLQRCFTWEPEKRLTPEDALLHRWILKGIPKELLTMDVGCAFGIKKNSVPTFLNKRQSIPELSVPSFSIESVKKLIESPSEKMRHRVKPHGITKPPVLHLISRVYGSKNSSSKKFQHNPVSTSNQYYRYSRCCDSIFVSRKCYPNLQQLLQFQKNNFNFT